MPITSLRSPDGTTTDIDVERDIAEDGGIATEELVIDWLDRAGEAGLTANELATHTGLSADEAHRRLVNLWENDIVTLEDEGPSPGLKDNGGRFFSRPSHAWGTAS